MKLDGKKAKLAVSATIALVVFFVLTTIPTPFFSKHFATPIVSESFYCNRDVVVSKSATGSSMKVTYTEYNSEGEIGEKTVELFYTGSALFSDFYQAGTGEKAEYDPELKLSGFGSGVGGTCY